MTIFIPMWVVWTIAGVIGVPIVLVILWLAFLGGALVLSLKGGWRT